MKRAAVKVVVALALLSGLGWLFVRSAQNVRSEPYELPRDRLAAWTLAIEPVPNASGVLLGLEPDKQTAAMLFGQVFSRTGESLSGPVPAAIPIVLQSEFDAARAGTMTAEALLAAARAAGLDKVTLQPRCMAQRRISEPGITRSVYFVRFDWPGFEQFRRHAAVLMRDAGGSGLEPDTLSPVLIVAGSDPAFGRWLPLKAETANDCLAPIATK
jgi:hypothetical protein